MGRLEPESLIREGGARPFALFIMTLAEHCPKLMCNALPPIIPFLDSDVFVFSNILKFNILAADNTQCSTFVICRYYIIDFNWKYQ